MEIKQVIHKGLLITDRFISEEGKVYDSSGIEIKLNNNGNGYFYVTLIKGIKGKLKPRNEYIHRLVAMNFITNPDNLPQVNHKDCNKSNNHVDNLEWISASDNIRHSHKSGRMQKRYEVGTIIPLSIEDVIYCYTEVKYNGRCITEIAKELGRSRTTISSIINKRSRRNITDPLDTPAVTPYNSLNT